MRLAHTMIRVKDLDETLAFYTEFLGLKKVREGKIGDEAVLVFLTDDDAAAKAVLDGPMGSRSIAGTADSLIEQLAAYEAAGFDEFIVPDFNLGDSREQRTDKLQQLHDEVVSRR